MTSVPELRVRAANAAEVRADGEYVVYWMIAARRTTANFALQRALDRARELGRPLVVLEALRSAYPHASDRLHRFVLAGMADTAKRLAPGPVLYHPYVEPEAGAGRGLLEALAARACLVVTDEYPCFFLPRMVGRGGRAAARAPRGGRLQRAASARAPPRRASRPPTPSAASCSGRLPRTSPSRRAPSPLRRSAAAAARGPARRDRRALAGGLRELLAGGPAALASLPIDHAVAPVDDVPGGASAARRALARFVAGRLDALRRGAQPPGPRRHQRPVAVPPLRPPGRQEVFAAVAAARGVDPSTGSRTGRPAAGPAGGGCDRPPRRSSTSSSPGASSASTSAPGATTHDRYESLPPWARATLAKHAGDRREHLYALDELEAAATHDPLWNAAQRQLRREGRVHNYLRMLWGKKILEWSATPAEALDSMIALNDRWALDGRDPNSYAGIVWCLGRYDRPWGPERPVFGTIRYMSSANTARKLRLAAYLARFGR